VTENYGSQSRNQEVSRTQDFSFRQAKARKRFLIQEASEKEQLPELKRQVLNQMGPQLF
jgi:hypothetical protein